MEAYKIHTVVGESGRLMLTGLPFKPGQRVEVVVVEEDRPPLSERTADLDRLFRLTQRIAQERGIADETVAHEVDACRGGQ